MASHEGEEFKWGIEMYNSLTRSQKWACAKKGGFVYGTQEEDDKKKDKANAKTKGQKTGGAAKIASAYVFLRMATCADDIWELVNQIEDDARFCGKASKKQGQGSRV